MEIKKIEQKTRTIKKHVWESTDNQGTSMICTVCGTQISFYDENWNEKDDLCKGKIIAWALMTATDDGAVPDQITNLLKNIPSDVTLVFFKMI